MKPRPTAYHRDQHDLICKALLIPTDPKAPGLTAYEGVCAVLYKLNLARMALLSNDRKVQLKVLRILRKPIEEFPIIQAFGVK